MTLDLVWLLVTERHLSNILFRPVFAALLQTNISFLLKVTHLRRLHTVRVSLTHRSTPARPHLLVTEASPAAPRGLSFSTFECTCNDSIHNKHNGKATHTSVCVDLEMKVQILCYCFQIDRSK